MREEADQSARAQTTPKMQNGALIDSCVLMDALLEFRTNHKHARKLLGQLARSGIVCYVPSHGFFELTVAALTHVKYERDKVRAHPINPKLVPNLNLQVVKLDHEYVDRLILTLRGKPYPDLKSQDLIYFCIARDRGLTLVTEDRKLRNTARRGGVESFDTSEVLELLFARNKA